MVHNRRTKEKQKLDSHLLVTLAIFKPGPRLLKNQKEEEKTRFPIKDFGNDGGGIPKCLYEESKQW